MKKTVWSKNKINLNNWQSYLRTPKAKQIEAPPSISHLTLSSQMGGSVGIMPFLHRAY